jgi:hypothetical protein
MMSKKTLVKPDHFKVAGRERPGKDVPVTVEKQQFAKIEEAARTGKKGKKLPAK